MGYCDHDGFLRKRLYDDVVWEALQNEALDSYFS